jgi:hypothetical protein
MARRSEWETRLFVEEPMLSTGLHFASKSTVRRLGGKVVRLTQGPFISDARCYKTHSIGYLFRGERMVMKAELRAATPVHIAEDRKEIRIIRDRKLHAIASDHAVAPDEGRAPNLDRHERQGSDHRWSGEERT